MSASLDYIFWFCVVEMGLKTGIVCVLFNSFVIGSGLGKITRGLCSPWRHVLKLVIKTGLSDESALAVSLSYVFTYKYIVFVTNLKHTRPSALVQDQHTRELISAQNT